MQPARTKVFLPFWYIYSPNFAISPRDGGVKFAPRGPLDPLVVSGPSLQGHVLLLIKTDSSHAFQSLYNVFNLKWLAR